MLIVEKVMCTNHIFINVILAEFLLILPMYAFRKPEQMSPDLKLAILSTLSLLMTLSFWFLETDNHSRQGRRVRPDEVANGARRAFGEEPEA